jgi:hypothetical protein
MAWHSRAACHLLAQSAQAAIAFKDFGQIVKNGHANMHVMAKDI